MKWVNILFSFLSIVVICYLNLNIEKIQYYHTKQSGEKHFWSAKEREAIKYRKLDKLLGTRNYVIFNCYKYEHPSVMFYAGFPAYDFLPGGEHIDIVNQKGKLVAIFDNGNLPNQYLTNDDIYKIRFNN